MKVIAATTQSDITSCYLIRTQVFVIEQHVDASLELDDFDRTADHYLLVQESQPIATCRIIIEGHHAKVGRFAVIKDARGHGIGAHLLREVEKLTISRHPLINEFILGAQLQALNFYAKSGYQPYGEIFDDAGIPHRMMRKLVK